ncbi:MAG: ATP-grasp fold amidoligase family protein, partial [Oceanihabitans sp.]
TKAKDVPFSKLPNNFVVKATHASSYNLIVTNKNKLDINKTKTVFNKWLQKNQYYRMGQEWAYKDVEPRLLVEKTLIEEGKCSLTDYKFYCFNGVVKFADVHLERDTNHQQGCYDIDFNLLPFRKKSKNKDIVSTIEKPSNYSEMIKLSEKLAENFPFVRVDFYSINGNAIFGEMTFYPSDGRKDFYPDKYNKIIGDYFELPELKKGQKVITNFN